MRNAQPIPCTFFILMLKDGCTGSQQLPDAQCSSFPVAQCPNGTAVVNDLQSCGGGTCSTACCDDIDACNGISCGSDASCADIPAPGTGYKCSCNPEFTGPTRVNL